MTVREWFRGQRAVQWHDHDRHQRTVDQIASAVVYAARPGEIPCSVPVENRIRLDDHSIVLWNYVDPLDAQIALCWEVLRGVTTRRVAVSYSDLFYGVTSRWNAPRRVGTPGPEIVE